MESQRHSSRKESAYLDSTVSSAILPGRQEIYRRDANALLLIHVIFSTNATDDEDNVLDSYSDHVAG